MRALEPHPTIALDSNVLIYLLESEGALAEAAASVVDLIESGAHIGVIAAIGVVEVLAGPARSGDAYAFESTADALRDLRLRVVPLDGPLAEDAAWIRGSLDIATEDAVHLATARRAGATAIVTNDRRIRSIPRLDVIYLDELVA